MAASSPGTIAQMASPIEAPQVNPYYEIISNKDNVLLFLQESKK